MTPEKIKLHTRDGSLELQYPGNRSVIFSAEFLRVHSPSAEVRGHGPGEEVLQYGKKNVKIAGVQTTGHYALLLEFDDGHNTGIYSWPYFAELHKNRDELWQAYLLKLHKAGQTRDPDEKVLNFFDPGKK